MTSKIKWLLPEGVDEILPPRALQIEKLRRRLVDLFTQNSYELIMPPIIEFSDTLGGEAHDELSEVSFTFRDSLSGKNISLRPDISSQASRIDAYRLDSEFNPKLCYVGDVIKSKSLVHSSSRLTVQAGAEIFGDATIDADLESIELMLSSLKTIGINDITLSLGHGGLINIIIDHYKKLLPGEEDSIRKALSTKSTKDIKEIVENKLDNDDMKMLLVITELFGGKEILAKAKLDLVKLGDKALAYLDDMENIVSRLDLDDVQIHIDLGEIQGFKYHTGLTFSAFIDDAGYPLSKGGRYDGISEMSDPRPAVGFDLDIVAVSKFTKYDLNES
jgi:ATP phosphoribosyltransferase regulatory subunit